jgi:hypothetical protein
MSTRTLVRGRTAFASKDWRPDFVAGAAPAPALERSLRDPTGWVGHTPIPPQAATSHQDGVAWRDPEDDVVYRVLAGPLLPGDGWASAGFWRTRWAVRFSELRRLVEMGLLDAALERDSARRVFRCRDERLVLERLRAQGTRR